MTSQKFQCTVGQLKLSQSSGRPHRTHTWRSLGERWPNVNNGGHQKLLRSQTEHTYGERWQNVSNVGQSMYRWSARWELDYSKSLWLPASPYFTEKSYAIVKNHYWAIRSPNKLDQETWFCLTHLNYFVELFLDFCPYWTNFVHFEKNWAILDHFWPLLIILEIV